MCAICAAVPTVAALGIAADGEQRKRRKELAARGETIPPRSYPIRWLTALGMLILFLIAAVYHTHQPNAM